MYVGASAAQSSWSIPPPAVRAPGRRGWGPSPGDRAAGWPLPIICVGRAVHPQLPIIYVSQVHTHTQLPIIYVHGSLRGPI